MGSEEKLTQSEFPLSSAISRLPDSVIKTTLYVTHLYGKVAFVEALLYVGRSSFEIQQALLIPDTTRRSEGECSLGLKQLGHSWVTSWSLTQQM